MTAGGVTQTRDIQGTWGLAGQSMELVAHFGLGAACDIESVEVRWPDGSGTVSRYTGVRANYEIELREGDAQVRYPTATP